MMRALTVLAAIAALALLAGCGGGNKKTIPSSDAASLIRALRSARALAGDEQKCPQLQRAVLLVQSRVASLPASVDKDTRDSLVNGTNNLIDNARSECANATTTPTTTTPTQTTPTQTTPTQTTPTQTTPTTPPPTTPTTPTQTTPQGGNGGVSPGPTPKVPPGQGKKGKKPKGEADG